MKHFNSIRIFFSCVLIAFILISCKKDPVTTDPPACTSCNQLSLTTMIIIDSSWVKQENGDYTSDITPAVIHSGISINQVYGINISDGNVLLPIFPMSSVNYMDGTIYGTVDLSENHNSVTLIFEFSKEEHEGEIHPGGSLPFKSVEIEVLLVNQNK